MSNACNAERSCPEASVCLSLMSQGEADLVKFQGLCGTLPVEPKVVFT